MFSYLIRHALIWARAGKKLKNFNGEFVYPLQSWITDCDMNMHVNTARYLVYMELARFDMSIRSGIFQHCIRKSIKGIVMGTKITYRREIKPLQKFQVHTQVVAYDDRFLYFDQQIISDKGIHAQGYLRTAFHTKNGFMPPKDFLAALGIEFQNAELPADLKLWVEAEDLVLQKIKKPVESGRVITAG
jgi:YbgC/YbaW family acyl-CoA thioester hydrolase